MIGVAIATTASYDDNTYGVYGFPIKFVLSIDHACFVQFATRKKKPDSENLKEKSEAETSATVSSNATFDTTVDVALPAGKYIFGDCHGIRLKTDGGTPAAGFIIMVQPEDPDVISFDPV